MGLSERDLRVLDEMERDLGTSDPGMILRMSRRHAHLGRAALMVATLIVGVGALFAGAALAGSLLIVGVLVSVAGFVLMVGASWQLCFGRTRNGLVKRTAGGRSSRSTTN